MLIAPSAPCPDTIERTSADAESAVSLIERVRFALQRAAAARDPAERQRWLTFVVIGAGQRGVGLAGAVAELVGKELHSSYGQLDPDLVRVVLTDPSIRVLPGWAKSLSSAARDALKRLGVELRLGVAVSEADDAGIVLAGKHIPSATVLWGNGGDRPGNRFAPVCRGFAVAEIGGLRLSGGFAWQVWRVASWLGAGAERGRQATRRQGRYSAPARRSSGSPAILTTPTW